MVAVAMPSMSPTPPSVTSLALMQIEALLTQVVPGCLGIKAPPVCITSARAGAGNNNNKAVASRLRPAHQVRPTRTALAIMRTQYTLLGVASAVDCKVCPVHATHEVEGIPLMRFQAKLSVLLCSG